MAQSRVKLEAEAMMVILERCESQDWILLNSDAIQFEINRNQDLFRKEQLEQILSVAKDYLKHNETIELSTQALVDLGFKFYDALHLSFAQHSQADVFLTTDDRLLKKAKLFDNIVTIAVENPVVWLMQILEEKSHENGGN
ncbi:MAG: PIN domain-containing protein [Synechocystis sp.]